MIRVVEADGSIRHKQIVEEVPSDEDGTIWTPEAAPASPSAYDDEFCDQSFNTELWTDYDVPGTLNKNEVEAGLVLTGTSGADVQGIYQDVPSSEGWSIITRVSWLHEQANDLKAGLLLLEDVNNLATSDCLYFAHYRGSSGMGFQVEEFNHYNSYKATHQNFVSDRMETSFFLRLRAASTSWFFDYSMDGLGWMNKWSMARTFTPEGFGLCVKVDTASAKPIFQFFRYVETVGGEEILQGNRVKYWR